MKQVDFLGRTITLEGVSPQVDKVKDFLAKLEFPKSKKGLQRYIYWFSELLQKLFTTPFGTTHPFHQTTEGNQQILHFYRTYEQF